MRKIIAALFVFSFLCCTVYAQGDIIKTDAPKGWIIKTKSSAYQIIITADGVVKPVFYGPREQADYQRANADWTQAIDEVPVRGGRPFKTPML